MALSLIVSRIDFQFGVHYDGIILVSERYVILSPGTYIFKRSAAGVEGFEPSLLGPEPSVLPLDHTPTNVREVYTREVQNTPDISICLISPM